RLEMYGRCVVACLRRCGDMKCFAAGRELQRQSLSIGCIDDLFRSCLPFAGRAGKCVDFVNVFVIFPSPGHIQVFPQKSHLIVHGGIVMSTYGGKARKESVGLLWNGALERREVVENLVALSVYMHPEDQAVLARYLERCISLDAH